MDQADQFLASVLGGDTFGSEPFIHQEAKNINASKRDDREESRRDDSSKRDDREETFDQHFHSSKKVKIQPQHDPGTPNETIILHGLSYGTSQETLEMRLKESGAKFESCRIVLDKQTGKSRGFAFVKFNSERQSRDWVERMLHLENGFEVDDYFCRIEYCKPLNPDNDWICFQCATNNFEKRVECFRCGLSKEESQEQKRLYEKERSAENDGERDIGAVPFKILLFRGLDPLTSEDAILQNTNLMCEPTSIWLVKNKSTRESLGFCFVEFRSIHDANVLLNKMYAKKKATPLYIEHKMIEVSYAHMGSFIPSPQPSPFASLVQDGYPLSFLTYWDNNAFARPFPESQVHPSIPPLPSIEEFQKQLLLAEEQKAAALLKRKKNNTVNLTLAAGTVKGQMSVQLQKWNEKYREIGNLDDLEHVGEDLERIPDIVLAKRIKSVSAINHEFSDLARIACLLPGCRRKFSTIPLLSRHQQESEFHAQNMRIYRRSLLLELREKMVRDHNGKLPQASSSLPVTIMMSLKKPMVTQQPTKHGIKDDNKGNQLLQKMGWRDGEMLGVSGHGLVKPIKVELRDKKKGIGASLLAPRSVSKR